MKKSHCASVKYFAVLRAQLQRDAHLPMFKINRNDAKNSKQIGNNCIQLKEIVLHMCRDFVKLNHIIL